jgi:hypothetical protein
MVLERSLYGSNDLRDTFRHYRDELTGSEINV